MRCWAVSNLARQIEGEYCLMMIEKAFTKKRDAEEYALSVKGQTLIDVTTPQGKIECLVERGILEFELEGVVTGGPKVANFGNKEDFRVPGLKLVSNGDELFGEFKYAGMVEDEPVYKRKGLAFVNEEDAVVVADKNLVPWRVYGEMEIEEFKRGLDKNGNNFKPTANTIWWKNLEEDS